MRTRLAIGLIVIAIAGTAVISLSIFSSEPESIFITDIDPSNSAFVPTAQAGAALSEKNTVKTMRVRIVETGHNNELFFGSFSRIGFIPGANDFLLESLPSEDKKPFYKFVKKSLENNNVLANPVYLDVNIDLFSGDYDLIETLFYQKCTIYDYFVHSVDSIGKISFLEGYEGIEIHEYTKFTCEKFELIIED